MKKYIIVALLLFASPAQSNEVENIRIAIANLLISTPGRTLTRNYERQQEIAEALIRAGTETNICPYLLLSIIWHESSLKLHARGKLGEAGVAQVHGVARNGCRLDTYAGQILCGARWLRVGINACRGSIAGGISIYATGKNCNPKLQIVRRRLRLWRLLRDGF